MAEVSTAGRPILLNLIAKGLVGGRQITLEDESGHFKIVAPAALWEFIKPGDQVSCTISPLKVTIIDTMPGPVVELPGLPRPN